MCIIHFVSTDASDTQTAIKTDEFHTGQLQNMPYVPENSVQLFAKFAVF